MGGLCGNSRDVVIVVPTNNRWRSMKQKAVIFTFIQSVMASGHWRHLLVSEVTKMNLTKHIY